MGNRVALSALAAGTVACVVGCGGAGTQTRNYRLLRPHNGVYLVARWSGNRPPPIPSRGLATVTAHAYGTPLCMISFPSTGKSIEVLATQPNRKLGDATCAFFRQQGGVYRTLH